MRSSIFAAFGLGVLALSSAALAAPTGFFAQISIETYDESFNTIEYREVLDEDFLEPGESKIILPYDEKVASPVLVTIDAVTVGDQRTVTITYEALEAYLVTPY